MQNIPDADLRASGAQIPLRRVVVVDATTGQPSALGGGGGATIDTAPLAKAAKQDTTNAALGTPDDAAAASDTAPMSLLAGLKRLIAKLPGLGAKASSGSMSVAPATDAMFQTVMRTSTTGGLTTARVSSAASTNATSLKTSAAMVYGYEFHNKSANILLVRLYNKASAPVPGTDTPVRQIRLPAGGMSSANRVHGLPFSLGLGFDIVTEAGAAVAAGDVMGSVDYV